MNVQEATKAIFEVLDFYYRLGEHSPYAGEVRYEQMVKSCYALINGLQNSLTQQMQVLAHILEHEFDGQYIIEAYDVNKFQENMVHVEHFPDEDGNLLISGRIEKL